MHISKGSSKKFTPKQVLIDPTKSCVRIWTDGSCLINPGGAGTWAFVIVEEDTFIHQHGEHYRSTTNNRMEIMGVLNAVKYISDKGVEQVVIYTDSQYVYNSVVAKKGKEANKNGDLLQALKEAVEQTPHIQYMWTAGHAGKKWNEHADELCREMYKKVAIPDAGYERLKQPVPTVSTGIDAKKFLLEKYLPTTSQEERDLWYKCSDWARQVVKIMEEYKKSK